MQFIKNRWGEINNQFANSEKYFQKSPSNMVQRRAISLALQQYATGDLLDIGAGRSVYRKFIPEGVRYSTFDFEETEARYEKKTKLNIIGDIQNMPIEDNTYDSILCTEVLEHVPEPQKAAQEIMRVLRPGGVAIITVPFLGYYHDEPHDFFRYTKHGLRVLFEHADASVIEQRGLGGLCSFLGYIRSTIVLSLVYKIPVVWTIVFYVNYVWSLLDVLLDTLLQTYKVMPLTNMVIVKKPEQRHI